MVNPHVRVRGSDFKSVWLELKSILGPRGARSRFQVELNHDVFADEIVGHPGKVDVEILPVDGEFGRHCHRVVRDLDLCRKREALGYPMQGEVTGHLIICPVRFDCRDVEARDGEFGYIEEIRGLQVPFQLRVVGPSGGHRDLEPWRAYHLAFGDGELASELPEPTLVAAGDFGADEPDFRLRAEHVFLAGLGRGGAWLLRVGGGGFRDLICRITASGEQADGRSDKGCTEINGDVVERDWFYDNPSY